MVPKGQEYAESYEAPKRGLLARALGFVSPEYRGYLDQQEEASYTDNVHFNPEDVRELERYRGVNLKSSLVDEQFDNTIARHKNYGQQTDSRLLSSAIENPENYLYDMTHTSQRDGGEWEGYDQTVSGSKVGTLYGSSSENNVRGVDDYNVANWTKGSKFLGIFPRGYSGSVNANPGIPSKVPASHWASKVDEPTSRMDLC